MGQKVGWPRVDTPSFRRRFVRRTYRGQLIAQSWPKKRRGARHLTNTWWSEWLKQADLLWKFLPDGFQIECYKAARGTAQLPRDLAIASMAGRLFVVQWQNGRRSYSMAVKRSVSESLDVIAQDQGDIMFRGSELWESLGPGEDGQVITWSSALGRPVWGTPIPGGDVYTPPDVADFATIFGTPTPTLANVATGPLVMNRPAASTVPSVAGAVRSLDTPTYEYRFGFRHTAELLTGMQFGCVLRDSATGRLVSFTFRMLTATSTPRLDVSYWNSPTSYQSQAAYKVMMQVGALFFRIKDDGTNFTFYASADDGQWTQVAQLGRTAWLANPDQVGFMVASSAVESIASVLSVFHFIRAAA